MSGNLDRALDDIIGSDRASRHGRRSRHSSPYARSGGGGGGGRWTHDRFDGPRSINERLGRRLGPSPSPSPPRSGRARQRQSAAGAAAKGLAIAGRTRDTAAYDGLRVVWVTSLPRDYTREKIETIFRDTGRIEAVRMAVDKDGLFAGKAEVVYCAADDARDAIQAFDGETLFTADSAGQVSMRVMYSSPKNAAYIDALRYESSRRLPVDQRLGAMPPVVPVLVALLAPDGGGGGSSERAGRRRDQSQSQNQHQNQRQRGGGGRRGGARPTAEELDAEMDAYMSSKPGPAAQPSDHRHPPQAAMMDTQDE
ncbi:hypothetical protein H4R18_003666 [Coemansia javaensis]|uniref:RRM domain-containing protein n=1 Tax=Coemansia javaensis TaxID=2761396 RepID=A0A9W8LFZ0_9FUNG|nr:hypothetical protein H4R18_003666 [Coemansia javaensis]